MWPTYACLGGIHYNMWNVVGRCVSVSLCLCLCFFVSVCVCFCLDSDWGISESKLPINKKIFLSMVKQQLSVIVPADS